MNQEYYYCSYCGYEAVDVFVAYSRQCASGKLYHCPNCQGEIYIRDEEEEEKKREKHNGKQKENLYESRPWRWMWCKGWQDHRR